VSEHVPNTWYLTAINCTPAANAVVDLAAGKVTVTLTNGADVTCTFVNQRGSPSAHAGTKIAMPMAPATAMNRISPGGQ
jgi:hypothetical protein